MLTRIVLGSFLLFAFSITHKIDAAEYFWESFDGPSLTNSLVDINNGFSMQNGELRSTKGRNYVRTAGADYNQADFEAFVAYSMNGGGGGGGFFFGLVPGLNDWNYFGEPLTSISAIDHAADFSIYQGTAVRSIPISGQ